MRIIRSQLLHHFMKKRFSSLFLFLLTGSLAAIIVGCGVKYTPPASDITLEYNRELAIEHQYDSSYRALGKFYFPLTYGDLIEVKPDSYRRLDSLYNRKYDLQRLGKTDESVESQIRIQHTLISLDSTPILYLETHWYEIVDTAIHEFVIDRITLTKTNEIVKVYQVDAFKCPPHLLDYARKYMREDYFVEYSGPTDEEIDFYTTFKEQAYTLTDPEKQQFILHTLHLMKLAHDLRTLSVEPLLIKLTQRKIARQDPEAEPDILHFTVESVVEERDGQELFLYYKVSAQATDVPTTPQVFKYDSFLQPVRE